MSGEPTTSAGAEPGFVHEALFYQAPDELLKAVVEFARSAADTREPVLAAVPRANLQRLRDALWDGPASVRFMDMQEIGGNPARLLPIFQDWIDGHDGPVRVISEPMWAGRSYAETVEVLRHEALLNHALAGSGATVLCPYDAANLSGEVLAGAELTHPHVRSAGARRPSQTYDDPLRVSLADRWPQETPTEPISEHRFDGNLASLRRDVIADPRLRGLSQDRREDVVFALNEAATNALRHGDGRFTARIWNTGGTVVSEVASESSLGDVLAGRRRPRPDARSGWGLWLINQVCDLVELRSVGGRMTLRMHVREPV